ncbi:MAG TPA: DNA-processing protein DprA, partial [Patescibacteria group bacterium]|nr:DNA-processing protein DprA [Patescibacteria group bacterium]
MDQKTQNTLNEEEEKYWCALSSLSHHMPPRRFHRLYQHFGSAQAIFHATKQELRATGLRETTISSLLAAFRGTDPDTCLHDAKSKGMQLVTYNSPNYPNALKKIYDPPFLLYTTGMPLARDESMLAVVGSRKMTNYGREVIKTFIPVLIDAGITIVSGLAFGVDAAAHQHAIDCGGKTIAVLGSGLNNIQPKNNAQLASDILKHNGTLLS